MPRSDGHRNNFDFIRFFSASLVIFSHAYPLTGFNEREPLSRLTGFIDFGTLAVRIFFCISGYLIVQSFVNRPRLQTFLKSRALRIYPGLIVAVLFSIAVGAIVSDLSVSRYFSDRSVASFLFHNVTFIGAQWGLPGVFLNNPYVYAVNGSLWTLPIEIKLYLLVALAGILSVFRKRWVANVSILAFVALFIGSAPSFGQIGARSEGLILSFALGSLYFINRDRIPLRFMGCLCLGLLAWFARNQNFMGLIFSVFLVYVTFYISFHPRISLHHFGKRGDFSYGLYVFAFPIQQVFAQYAGLRSPFLNFALSYPLALGCAVLSWHFIEKPALALKKGATLFRKNERLPASHLAN
jgi:peptidoglycan/LPS O-acetylase OafA/YrhL